MTIAINSVPINRNLYYYMYRYLLIMLLLAPAQLVFSETNELRSELTLN